MPFFPIMLERSIFSMKEISDVYVGRHGDSVGGGALSWLVTLTERCEPIRDQLCCPNDVTLKGNKTVTRLLNSTTAKRQKIWLNTSEASTSLLLHIIAHSNWNYGLGRSTEADTKNTFWGAFLWSPFGSG